MTSHLRPTLPSPLAAALIAVAVFGAASSARAQSYPPEPPHEGIYFAGGLGVSLQLIGGSDSAVGGQGELRFGYSFGRHFQIYLDGVFSGSSHDFGTITASDIAFGLRYFFFSNRNVGVYGRTGLGLGIVTYPGIAPDGSSASTTELGIAESLAFGMEFRLGGGNWSLSPELFYRGTNENSANRVDTLGLGFLINFN